MDHFLEISKERTVSHQIYSYEMLQLCCSCVTWPSKILHFSVSKSTFNLIPGGFTKVLEHLKCVSVMPHDITVCILPSFTFSSALSRRDESLLSSLERL